MATDHRRMRFVLLPLTSRLCRHTSTPGDEGHPSVSTSPSHHSKGAPGSHLGRKVGEFYSPTLFYRLEVWRCFGTGCPEQWWSHHPWRVLKAVSMWHLETWVSSGLGSPQGTVGLGDLRGFFQPQRFCVSAKDGPISLLPVPEQG